MKDIVLRIGQKIKPDDLQSSLFDIGFEKVETVTGPGQFSLSGGTIKIYLIDKTNPVTIDLFGEFVDEIYLYHIKDNKKIAKLKEIIIFQNILVLTDSAKIKPESFLVHEDYGIGQFKRLSLRKINNGEKEYIDVEYQNGDILYAPKNQIDKLSSYIGVGRKKPKLSKMGSETWKKTYKKTYENIIHMAHELLNIYAAREVIKRKPWKINKEWDAEIKKTFSFIETKDQEIAITETLESLKNNIPMDRLLIGDVGFGKTEVAIRAATQAAANGYQAVLLVPTTILAEQHFVTLKQRFKNLPVRVERLSRFTKKENQREIFEKIKNGSIDIIIGTHRLLDENLRIKNVGLYVIDEEQKFGVKQKERLKKIHTEVNVLSLSATPIPRTLFMSLSGIRDISQINTSPKGRKEIKTEVKEFQDDIVKKYIDREMKRGGQVYYLHNEVETIEGKCQRLKKIFPNINIKIGHGQMPEEKLAETMANFADGNIQILVCSTIIESGLDISNVNTLIVEDSDKFGLSQLYQIRGRIGRSPKQAYALFTFPHKKITDNAVKRLKALAENTELGSGINISMSDLEIRGGGNILGREQHGNMESVGLVLYSKLLKTAVLRLKNK